MNRIQISETEYRWYETGAAWAQIDGEAARAELVEGQWKVKVFERGMVAHGLAETIGDAEEIVNRRVSETLAREARYDAMESAALAAKEARERDIRSEQDNRTRDLMEALDRATESAERRSVSHPSYGLSGRRARDEAEIAAIEIQIENRRAELASKQEAA